MNFREMSDDKKAVLVKNISKGLPFTDYWIHKTLTEIDPLILDVSSTNGMYIDGGYVKKYLEKLIKNSFN